MLTFTCAFMGLGTRSSGISDLQRWIGRCPLTILWTTSQRQRRIVPCSTRSVAGRDRAGTGVASKAFVSRDGRKGLFFFGEGWPPEACRGATLTGSKARTRQRTEQGPIPDLLNGCSYPPRSLKVQRAVRAIDTSTSLKRHPSPK
jgi:hypothetical protein